MSITPGFKHKRRLLRMALKRPADNYGVDYIAAGATVIPMLTKGVSVNPWQTEQISRDLDDGKSGGQPVIHTGEMISISGALEMAGSGTANTAPPWSAMVQICGFGQNATGSQVDYERILQASNELDGTLYFEWEGMTHKMLAARGSLGVTGKIGELGYLNFECKGVYGGTVTSSITNASFSAWQTPREWSTANTEFTLDGTPYNLIEFECNTNNEVELDEGTALKRMFINDWNEETKFVIEAPELGTFDPFAVARQNVLMPWQLTHGLTAGHIYQQASTGMQLLSIEPGEHKGKLTWQLTGRNVRGHDSVITTK